MKTLEEIEGIIEAARGLKCEAVEIDGIKYILGNHPTIRPKYVPEVKAEDIVKPLPVFEELTDEEIMYYSTPYFDELQANKEARTKQQKMDDSLKAN